MPGDTTTTPLALVGVFIFLTALAWICVSSGASESKRLALKDQENFHVASR